MLIRDLIEDGTVSGEALKAAAEVEKEDARNRRLLRAVNAKDNTIKQLTKAKKNGPSDMERDTGLRPVN
jgi:hypothetical protein